MRKKIKSKRIGNLTICLEKWYQGVLKDYIVNVTDYDKVLYEAEDMTLKQAKELFNELCQENEYIKVIFTIKNAKNEWKETFYLLKNQDPELYAKRLLMFFNNALRPHELPREFVNFALEEIR